MTLVLELATSPNDDVRALVTELEATLAAEYPPEQRHGLSLGAIFQPHVRFFVARDAGAAVGCAGVALFDGFAELKRMYVRPAARGRGVAEALLSRIEEVTRDAGIVRLVLETGDRQLAAMRFYERAGFARCTPFGVYLELLPRSIVTSVFFEKRIAGGARPAPALSVLDLSPVSSGKTARDALLATVDLARHAESLGLHRYWVAEHHNAKGIACSAPEVSIAQIAAATTNLRVGSGGVMLPNHAPLRVAETFRTLEGFFPGRIDLGVGRAAGTDPRTARLLRRARDTREMASPDDFPDELAALLAFLSEHDPPRAAFASSVVAIPAVETAPEVFVLGSSDFGGALAARMGLGFAFAHQINPADAVKVLRAYKRDFVPSKLRAAPYAIVSVAAFAAEDEASAADATLCTKLATLRFAQGTRDLPMPSVAEARAHAFDAEELALIDAFARGRHVGTAKIVREKLRELADEAAADEVMVMSMHDDHDARKRSYSLLSAFW